MLRLGWQTFCAHLAEVVDPARVRRAAWVAVIVGVIVIAGLFALQLLTAWPGVGPFRSVFGTVVTGLGIGAVAFACCPTAIPPDPSSTINGRQVRADHQMNVRWSVEPYLLRRGRPVQASDRAAVLNDVPLLRRGLVRRLTRLGPLMIGIALLGCAWLLLGSVQSLVILWPFFYLALLPELLVRLGRAERAGAAALAAPEPPDETAPTLDITAPAQRRRDPAGSKVALPDE